MKALGAFHGSSSPCVAAQARSSGRPLRSFVVLRAKASSSSEFEQNFTRFVRDTQRNWDKNGKPRVEEFVEDMKSNAQRTYVKLDSEYDLSARAAKASKRVRETAQDVDQQYGVRRRLRSLAQRVQKNLPVWSRRFEEFSATTVGKVAIVAGVFVLLSTPLFWRVLNTLLLLWWLALPIATLLIQQSQAKQAQAAAEEAERRRRNPFANIFRGSGFGGRSGGAAPKQSKSQSYSGPIIEAEWVPLDEKK